VDVIGEGWNFVNKSIFVFLLMQMKSLLLIRWGSIDFMANIVSLANSLVRIGYKVTIVTIESTKSRPASLHESVQLLGLNAPRKLTVSAHVSLIMKLQAVRKSVSADIEYVVDSWTFKIYLPARIMWRRGSSQKMVYHTFDWLEPGLHSRAQIFSEKYACRVADLVVNADPARARLQKTIYRLQAKPVHLRNGISRHVPVPGCDIVVRASLSEGIKDARIIVYPTVISDAASSQRQAFELVQSLQFLPENYALILFGTSGEYYEQCVEVAKNIGVDSRVKILKPRPFDDLLVLIASADFGAIFYDDSESSGYYMCNADKVSVFAAMGVCCDSTDPYEIAAGYLKLDSDFESIGVRKRKCREAFESELCSEAQDDKLLTIMSKLG
jgi:hypothetical protein